MEKGAVSNALSHSTRFWMDVLTAFSAIFIAEWGDLTQLATATLVAKYGYPLLIFSSATLALWTVAAISVTVAHQSRKFLNPKIMKWAAVTVFLGVGLWFVAS